MKNTMKKIFAFFLSLTLVSCISVEQYNKNLETPIEAEHLKKDVDFDCPFCYFYIILFLRIKSLIYLKKLF